MKQINVPQSGSQANTTASRNRFGQYTRNRRAPVNVNSPAQQLVRAAFSAGAKAWKGLTQLVRDSWNSYAAGRTFTDSLGQTITLTGFQAFVGQYALNLAVGIAAPVNPPAGAIPVAEGFTVGASTAVGLDISINAVSPTPLPYMEVFTSPPMSAGRSFNSDYRLVTVKTGVAADDSVILAADLAAKWGTLSAGQKFFVKVIPVSATGVAGAPVFTEVTLT